MQEDPPSAPLPVEEPLKEASEAEQRGTAKEEKGLRGRASFRAEPLFVGARGGAVDLSFLYREARLGGRLAILGTEGPGGAEQLVSLSLLGGLSYPGTITPFVEGYLGGGFWHQTLFGEELFLPSLQAGVEGGAEVYVGEAFFLFGAVGYAQTLRQSQTLLGQKRFESFGGGAFRVGVGFGQRNKNGL